jgi:hypothetical protein
MKPIRFARTVVAELVALILDDVVTFVGGALALLVMWAVAHQWHDLRHAAGFLAVAVVWIGLALSFARSGRTAPAGAPAPAAEEPVTVGAADSRDG